MIPINILQMLHIPVRSFSHTDVQYVFQSWFKAKDGRNQEKCNYYSVYSNVYKNYHLKSVVFSLCEMVSLLKEENSWNLS